MEKYPIKCPTCHKLFDIEEIEVNDKKSKYICPSCESFLTDLIFLQEIETKTKIIENGPKINNPVDLIAYTGEIADCDSEKILIFYVSGTNKVLCYSILSSGFVGDVMISPRHIVKNACLCGATGVIIIHNHPSGSIEPSKVDRLIVDKLNMAFSYFDSLKLLDFMIVTHDKFWSMAEEARNNEKEQKNEM